MATYDFSQQTFCLSMLSNLASGMDGSADKLAAAAKTSILKVLPNPKTQALIGDWQLVWGPQVVVGPLNFELSHKAINTMYIARNDTSNTFVVAIAGTNASSVYDWFVEDFWVNHQVSWPFLANTFKGATPKISNGTNFGLNQLIGMADNQVSAREYLRDNVNDGSTVMVSGHSLGGALSPAYALYLKDTAKEWNPNGKAALEILATAGATPGDSNFVTYFNERTLKKLDRVWGSIDVVPHAWEADLLAKIPTLYAPTIEPDLFLKALATLALYISRKGDYQQLNNATGFPSTVQSETGSTLEMFLKELTYQHIQGYYNHFDVLAFQTLEKELLAKSTAEVLMDKDYKAIAIKLAERIIVKAVEHKVPGIDIKLLKEGLSKL